MPRRNETVSLNDILFGVGHGRSQSVGNMEVIPLVDEGNIQDERLDPPEVEVGTSHYGTVNIRNRSSNPTVVPTGAGWVVEQAAQDHAIGSAALMKAKSERNIETAMCIQASQGGTISRYAHDFLVLPVDLRTKALSLRKQRQYGKLWPSIGKFSSVFGLGTDQNLVRFLREFNKQLDHFVAEFELVSKQIGAVILINGKLVGIELAPSVAFWERLWVPLVRVCYGSLSLAVARSGSIVPNRDFLFVEDKSLDGISAALESSNRSIDRRTESVVDDIKSGELILGNKEESMKIPRGPSYTLTTVASEKPTNLAGQIVRSDEKTAPYISVCTVR